MVKDRQIKSCKLHGLTEFSSHSKRGGNTWRCLRCLSDAKTKCRIKLKTKCVEYKGGKCEKCGYSRCISALEFHHKDPSQKEFGISSKGIIRDWESTRKELDKCDILCANCHRESHFLLSDPSES
jgi:hypothetical protein